MNLKKLTAQVSIFLSDGIMNPNRYKQKIYETFDNVFEKDMISLNIPNAPDDMPLLNCASKDNVYSYTFSKKRLNFTMNFLVKNPSITFEEYKSKILKLINESLLMATDISRIGIAFLYYYDIDDSNNEYWIKKYQFPLTTNNTSELTYTINNSFQHDGVDYNNIITLSNVNINNKIFPSVSVDINNKATKSLNEKQLEFIFKKCNKYDSKIVTELLDEQK